jgi:hypothetical protein
MPWEGTMLPARGGRSASGVAARLVPIGSGGPGALPHPEVLHAPIAELSGFAVGPWRRPLNFELNIG